MNRITKFFHEMFHPHCDECNAEEHCNTCDTLRQLLETEKFEKTQLLNYILNPKNEGSEIQSSPAPVVLKPRNTPWHVRRQMLEEDDKKRAQILAGRDKEIAELEKNLGVSEDASEVS